VRDEALVLPYNPAPTLPTANLLYGEVAYVTDKVRRGARARVVHSGGAGRPLGLATAAARPLGRPLRPAPAPSAPRP
jgi:hypothetical protein